MKGEIDKDFYCSAGLYKETFCLPIGIVPEWLLKAETGKGLWEHMIPDEEHRKTVLKKIEEMEYENRN